MSGTGRYSDRFPAVPKVSPLIQAAGSAGRRVANESRAAFYARRAGALGGDPPRRAAAVIRASARYGQLAAAMKIAAIRHGDRPGVIDELGALTFAELDARSDALAVRAARPRRLREGDAVGILCRNHRGFLDITFAAAKLGARDAVPEHRLRRPAAARRVRARGVALLVHDEEYERAGRADRAAPTAGCWAGPTDGPPAGWAETLEAHDRPLRRPGPRAAERARPTLVLLTSGTTGTPKGAPRSGGRSLAPIGALLSKVPYRVGRVDATWRRRCSTGSASRRWCCR